MGAIANALLRNDFVDFRAVHAAASKSVELVVSHYLPGGRWDGSEYVVVNPTRNDAKPGSFKISRNGVWSDFATKESGADMIDLVVYLTGKTKVEAARELGDMLNVRPSLGSTSLTGNVKALPKRKPTFSTEVVPADKARIAPTSFPPRTPPDEQGKPRFVVVGDQGPRVRDYELRRHVYRQGGIPIRIKIMRKGGDKPYNVYRVVDTGGRTGWQYKKPEGFLKAPYFTGPNPFDGDQLLYWPEGEKDVETLEKEGLTAFTFGGTGDGLPYGCEEYVRGRDVIILADNDDVGREHAGTKAALVTKVAASVKVVHFPELANKGDISDWIEAGHTSDELRARVEATEAWQAGLIAKPAPEQPEKPQAVGAENKLPFGYRFRDDGLYWSDPNDPEKPDLKLSGCFDIVAETRDGEGASWGVLLEWRDRDDRKHRLALPKAMLAGDGSDARRALLDGGLFVAPGQKARSQFNSFLLQIRSPNRARATQRIGWHGQAFVLPDESFGEKHGDKLLLQTTTAREHTFRQAGTLQSWQENVAKLAVGNSQLILALSAAFAGPLIAPCSAEGGGLHIRGASSTGKSTALHVAGSVWGGGSVMGFVRSWRATSNGLEGVALSHCDTLLCLDELSQLAAREAGEAAYMLANGSGKARSARDGSVRRPASWRVMFLSSGEIGLADKIAEDGRGRKMAAGQRVRIVDVPADAGAGMGMFENLHGFATPDALARRLREAAQQHYGIAGRAFLREIVPMIGELQKQVADITKLFSENYVPRGADGQVERVAQRFAIIASGGEIAARANVLPWARGAALEAAARVFESWIEARGGSAPAEERDGVETVRSFLLANGMARFLPAWEEDTDKRSQMVRDVAGYRQKAGDGWDYFVTSSAWKEICAGLDPRRTAGVLVAKGFIEKGDGAHLSKVIRVPGHGRLRLYHVLSTFLEGDEDETLAADLAPLLKKRGDSRDTGAESRNQLNLARFAVTTSPNAASPVADQVVTPPKRTGDEKRKGSQFFTGGGTTVTSVTTVLEQGRASKRDVEGPSEWRAILEELKLCETPEWLSNDRWAELLVDADTFVSTWGISAKRLGWTALDLFGVYPIAPAARFDVMGLIPMLTGGEVIALTDTAATIRRPSGAVLTYRRSEQSGAVLLSEVKKTARSDVQYGLGCRNLAGG